MAGLIPSVVLVNNMRFGWNSSRFLINNLPLTGLQKVGYKIKLEQENTYANNQTGTAVGYVYGNFSVDSFTLTFLKQDSQQFTNYLATLSPTSPGYIGSPFRFMAQCDEPLTPGAGPITITANTCRVTEKEDAYEPGAKALVDVFTIMALTLIENGKTLYDPSRNLSTSGPGY